MLITISDVGALFRRNSVFIGSYPSFILLPQLDLPEICFIGRSNSGKSTLVNSLVGRKYFAKVAKKPGRTKTMNLFTLDDKLSLIDLPGHGYAKVSKALSKSWLDNLDIYLKNRSQLRRAFFLIDSRRGVKSNDHSIMNVLESYTVPFQIVITKVDKIKSAEIKDILNMINEEVKGYSSCYREMILTSSKNKQGIDDLRNCIAGLAC